MFVCFKNILGEEEEMRTHCIIVEHGALMEYERNILWFLEKVFFFHSQNLLFWCIYHTFINGF
jgi:hypothetical protein